MIHTQVGFRPMKSVPNVVPPIVAGRPDSIWVITRTRDKAEISQAARVKLQGCYGLDIPIVDVYDGDQFGKEEV